MEKLLPPFALKSSPESGTELPLRIRETSLVSKAEATIASEKLIVALDTLVLIGEAI